MTRHLIYVIGPSGAGKDSVLEGLREAWVDLPDAYWTRRTITRSSQPGGEDHECVTELHFSALQSAGAFAMCWQANGLSYGIRRIELLPLAAGKCVFVNGSRAYLPAVLAQWPDATVVQITAPSDVLQKRLHARKRESDHAIAERLARSIDLELPNAAIQILNDGQLSRAVGTLLLALQARFTEITVDN